MSRAGADGDADDGLAEVVTTLAPLPRQAFEMVLRQILLPNEEASDLERWSSNAAFKEAVRSLFLRKRYGDTPTYARAMAALASPNLPTRREVLAMFGLERPPVASWTRSTPKNATARQNAIVARGRAAQWTTEEALEAGGCSVAGRSEFNLCCEDLGMYEFLTKEYVVALARYLHGRAKARVPGGDELRRPGAVVEVGAGSGRLTFMLNKALRSLAALEAAMAARAGGDDTGGDDAPPAPALLEIVATDNDVRAAPRQREDTVSGTACPVEVLDYVETIETYRPSIVICSWMPMDQDWSDQFRSAAGGCVHEYVLIGEADYGACGHNWKTWGNPDYQDDGGGDGPVLKVGTLPPHIEDDFVRHDLPQLSKFQMQRYDSDDYQGNSVTVSFQRSEAEEKVGGDGGGAGGGGGGGGSGETEKVLEEAWQLF